MTYNDAYFSFNETTLPHSGPTAAPGVVEPLAGIIGPLPIRGGSKEGGHGEGGGRGPSEISGPMCPPPQKKKFKIRPSLAKIFKKLALQ